MMVYVTVYEVAELKSMYQVMMICKTRRAVGMMMN